MNADGVLLHASIIANERDWNIDGGWIGKSHEATD